MDRWLAAQTNMQTWSAQVIQTRTMKTFTQPLMATGQVWFAAPDRFRWEIGNPAQTIAVKRADEMLVIYPRLKRVEKYPLNAAGQWKETLALLEAGFPRDRANLESRFRVAGHSSSNEVHGLLLEPKSSAARRLMPHIKIFFATNDLLLRATELEFADGSIMRNDFRKAEINPQFDQGIFSPKFESDFKIVEPLKSTR